MSAADVPSPWRSTRRAILTVIFLFAVYEFFARSGKFSPALMPTLGTVGRTLLDMLIDGTILQHAAATLTRVLVGFGIAAAVAIPLGIWMGRRDGIANFFLPLVTALMPIPSLAWVPIFILWCGIGNMVSILVVFYAALFPLLLNTYTGVRSVNPLWLRAASSMGAREGSIFWKVVIPGASAFIIAGLRQSFVRAWIAVIGAEMLASSDYGLGWKIFDAKEFLNADVMLASVAVIGFIGFMFERLAFGSIEKATVVRWGMVKMVKG
jgi:NitT/TauT family transport system permease protein